MKFAKTLITISALLLSHSLWALTVEDAKDKSGEELEQIFLQELETTVEDASQSEIENVVESFLTAAVTSKDPSLMKKIVQSIQNVLTTGSSYNFNKCNRVIRKVLVDVSKSTRVDVTNVVEDISYDG